MGSTEHSGRVINIPVSYSGRPGFKSWPRDQYLDLGGFHGFPQIIQTNTEIVPKN
jgi:hypothetical protein